MNLSRARSASPLLLLALLLAGHALAQPGSPEPGFDLDGRVLLDVGEDDVAYAVALEPDGAVVTLGSTEEIGAPGTRQGHMARFAADGSLLLSRAYPNVAFGCTAPLAYLAGLRLAEGDILAAGYRQTDCGGSARDFVLRRLRPDGSIADIFEVPVFQGVTENARALALAPGGAVVAAGWSSTDVSDEYTWDLAIARWLPDGSLDDTFAGDGERTVDFDGGYDIAYAVAVDAAGRIVVGGSTLYGGQRDALLVRLLADGRLDFDFGSEGFVVVNVAGFDDTARGLRLDAQGRIVVAMQSTAIDGSSENTLVLRFAEDGSLDLDFGTNGFTQVDLGTDAATPAALAIDSLGRILVAGSASDAPGDEASRDFVVAALSRDGQLLQSFGQGGVQRVVFSPGPVDTALALAVDDEQQRIAIAGYSGMRDPDDRLVRDMAVTVLEGLPGPAIFANGFEAPPPTP